MRLDYSTTKNRVNLIRNIISAEEGLTINKIAKMCKIPQSTISLYVNKYLKDILSIKKKGKEKRVFMMPTSSKSLFEKNLEKYKSRIDTAIELRKKGLSYSEIKHCLMKDNLRISDGILSDTLRHIKIGKNHEKRYLQKMNENKQKAGKMGGKIRASMEDFRYMLKRATKKAIEINTKKIPGRSKELTKEKIRLIGHCQFDGSLVNMKGYKALVYTNKSKFLINQFKQDMLKVYGLSPTDIRIKGDKVFNIRYCCLAALLDLDNLLERGIPEQIMKASTEEKLIFLKTFWDDEGSVHFGITRSGKESLHINLYAEAFCEDEVVRRQLIKLHEDLGFSMLLFDKKIRISRKENLIKFRNELGFSPGVYISYPKSKFNGWEKRKLLDFALNFRREDATNLYRDLWLQ